MSAQDPREESLSDSNGPPAAPGSVKALLARALLLLEQEGEDALQRWLAEQPAHADELRARVRKLGALGLLDAPDGAAPAPLAEATARASGELAPNTRLGPYRLVREIGAGGMGLVFLARDERLGRNVALKTISSALALSARARERFLREVRAVAQLEHAHIVRIFDYGEQHGMPWFTMEYVEGRTLAALLDERRRQRQGLRRERPSTIQRRLDAWLGARVDARDSTNASEPDLDAPPHDRNWVEAMVRIVADVASALAHAHAAGIVHRDVKPSNVLLDAAWSARLFDFGLARNDSDASLTHTGAFLGTPHYVAPELSGAKESAEQPEPTADIYSLGATLYELLALRPPFDGASTAEILHAIQTREPPSLRALDPTLPRDVATICETALQKDPRRRYASARAFEDDLRRFLEHRPILARPVGRGERVLRFAQRNPAWATAIVLGALVVLGVPIGLWIHTRELEATNEQLGIANGQKDEANQQLAAANTQKDAVNAELARSLKEAEATADVCKQMIELADAEELGRNAPVIDLLHRVREPLAALVPLAPLRAAGLQRSLGAVMALHGAMDEAKQELDSAAELFRKFAGPDSPELAITLNHIGNWHRMGSHDDLALPVYRDALEIWKRARLDQVGEGRLLRMNMARLLMDDRRVNEAEALVEPLRAAPNTDNDEDVRTTAEWIMYKARSSFARREYAAAYPALSEALELARQHPDMRLLFVAQTLQLWARCDRSLTRFTDATAAFLCGVDACRSIHEVVSEAEREIALEGAFCASWAETCGLPREDVLAAMTQRALEAALHSAVTLPHERARALALQADLARIFGRGIADPAELRALLASFELDPEDDQARTSKVVVAARLAHALLARGERAAAEIAYLQAEGLAKLAGTAWISDIHFAQIPRMRMLLDQYADAAAACAVADELECVLETRKMYVPWRLYVLADAPRARVFGGFPERALADAEYFLAADDGQLPNAWRIRMRVWRALARWSVQRDASLRLDDVLPAVAHDEQADADAATLTDALRSSAELARRSGMPDLERAIEAALRR